MRESSFRQRGMALIASLLILLLVTVAGVATMEGSGMQLKMANAGQGRQGAFEAAEAALRLVEENIEANTDQMADNDNIYTDCSGTGCYSSACTGGLCFTGGEFNLGDDPDRCSTVDPDAPRSTDVWETGTGSDYLNVWDDTSKHRLLTVAPYTNSVKYIVEFRCFTAADPGSLLSNTNAAQIFRITTRGMSDSGRAEVMLQSTYKRTTEVEGGSGGGNGNSGGAPGNSGGN